MYSVIWKFNLLVHAFIRIVFVLDDLIWYGDHSGRVTSDLVPISVIKSTYVLFGTVDGISMGILESCRPLIIYFWQLR